MMLFLYSYATAVKYITGTDASPTITVIAEDVNNVEAVVIANIESVLAESYPNAEFTITDAGSKMEAAKSSSNTLTMLLAAMATIVFIVGGIGIMNVLFVSVKERTKEIGILKAIGCSKRDILIEFLLEAAFISTLGGILGVGLSLIIIPLSRTIWRSSRTNYFRWN
jgi:ABC-type antimicrobial peptide transport system permease subunit